MNTLQKLCSGSLPISAAFWGFLIGGGAAVLFAIGVIGGVTVIAYPAARIPVYVTGFVVLWAYLILACFVTWRSASATKTGPLRIAAKVVVILLAVWFLFSLSTRNGVIAMLRGSWQPGSYLQGKTKSDRRLRFCNQTGDNRREEMECAFCRFAQSHYAPLTRRASRFGRPWRTASPAFIMAIPSG